MGKKKDGTPDAKNQTAADKRINEDWGIEVTERAEKSVDSARTLPEKIHKAAAELSGDNKTEKSMDAEKVLGEFLSKAGEGEGSRGGHIIGHTSSGKPVYESSSGKHAGSSTYSKFSKEDHEDAAKIHGATAAKERRASFDKLNAEKPSNDTRTARVKDIEAKEKQGRDAAASHRKAATNFGSKDHMAAVTGSGKAVPTATHKAYQKVMGVDLHSQSTQDKAVAHMKKVFPSFSAKDHADAAQHHDKAYSKLNSNSHDRGEKRQENQMRAYQHDRASFVHKLAADAIGDAHKSMPHPTLSKAAQTLALYLGDEKLGEVEVETQDLAEAAANGKLASGTPEGTRPGFNKKDTYGAGVDSETPRDSFTGYTDADIKSSAGVDGKTFGTGAPDVPSTILQTDDVLNMQGEPRNKPQALTKVNKSMDGGNYTQQELRHRTSHAEALHRAQAIGSDSVRIAPAPAPRPQQAMAKSVRPDERHGCVIHGYGSDARAAEMAKGESFYIGSAPALVESPLQKSVGCQACGSSYPSFYSSCPQCGSGGALSKAVHYGASSSVDSPAILCNRPAPTGDVHFSQIRWGSEA